jgi:FtsP/CotA-like multicopper oxidase with cupredoxin domain
MTRTQEILLLVVSVLVLICGGCIGVGTWLFGATTLDTAGEVAFVHPMAVPPLATSTLDSSGRRVFDLSAGAGTHDFGDRSAPTWGFNGAYLGPTLRATRGEQVVVNVHNGLTEPTTVHWHGMHLPAAMDGGPHQPIAPGANWSPTWTIDQPAATLWYHPHPHEATAEHVYRGLAGMFIVDDPATGSPALPHDYGVDDFPVIVQDKAFQRDGDLDESGSFLGGVGQLGDSIAVNGTTGPYLDVHTGQVRLRLLNASNARIYDFGFADDRAFAVIGTDGGLLAAPYQTDRVTLSPGERAEIVLAMRAGERAVLRSTPPSVGLDGLSARFTGLADTLDVLELRAGSTLTAGPPLRSSLTALPRLDPASAGSTRDFRLTDRQINGRHMDLGRIDLTAVRDMVERWRVTNSDGIPHNFHIHGVSFQLSTVDGSPPGPELAGWKDTILLRPRVTYELLVPFGSDTDPDTPYMYHCHLLFHEDRGMMGQFVVVAPGQSAGTPHQHGS